MASGLAIIAAAMPSVVRRPATAEPARRRVQRLVDRVTRGYLVKGATKTEVARALHDVAAGGAVFGEGVTEQVLLRVRESPITGRELEVLALVAGGPVERRDQRQAVPLRQDRPQRRLQRQRQARRPGPARRDPAARRAGLGELR